MTKKQYAYAPLYIAVAWILILLYQLFTGTALRTIMNLVSINTSDQIKFAVTFLNGFVGVWLLSSAIPSILIKKSFVLQFFLVVTLTALVTMAQTAISLQQFTWVFTNPFIALVYLFTPYVTLIYLDLKVNRKPVVYEPKYVT